PSGGRTRDQEPGRATAARLVEGGQDERGGTARAHPAHYVSGSDAETGQRAAGIRGPVLRALHGPPQRSIPAGDQPDDGRGRAPEGGWAPRRIENAEPPAGPGSKVDEATAGPERVGDELDGAGERPAHASDGRGRTQILPGDDGDELHGGQSVEAPRRRILSLRGEPAVLQAADGPGMAHGVADRTRPL